MCSGLMSTFILSGPSDLTAGQRDTVIQLWELGMRVQETQGAHSPPSHPGTSPCCLGPAQVPGCPMSCPAPAFPLPRFPQGAQQGFPGLWWGPLYFCSLSYPLENGLPDPMSPAKSPWSPQPLSPSLLTSLIGFLMSMHQISQILNVWAGWDLPF